MQIYFLFCFIKIYGYVCNLPQFRSLLLRSA